MSGDDVLIKGTLTVDEGIIGRDSLFIRSFSRLAPATVAGPCTVEGNFVAELGASVAQDLVVGTHLQVSGTCGVAGTATLTTVNVTGTLTASAVVSESSLTVASTATVGGALTAAGVVSTGQIVAAASPAPTLLGLDLVDPGKVPLIDVQAQVFGNDNAGGLLITSTSGAPQTIGVDSTITILYGTPYPAGRNSFALAQPTAGTWGSMRLGADASQAGIVFRVVGPGTATIAAGSPLTLTWLALGVAT